MQNIEGVSYHVDCFEVNAVNYGAPQLRERALFIGNRFNEEIGFPGPTHGMTSPRQEDRSLFPIDGLHLMPWRTLGNAIRGLVEDDPVILDFSPRKKKYLSMVPPGGNWRSLPPDVQRESMGKAYFAKGGRSGWWRRLSYDLPCPTLVTMPNHASTSLCHPEEVRALSVREYCRIQGFPDEWQVCGTPTQQYAQIGNAVPVRLGEVAGEVIGQVLDALARRRWRPGSRMSQAFNLVYIKSHVRTRQWFKNGRAFRWKDGGDNRRSMYSPSTTTRV
jgi:DNA (cytosine-5)-methyltransferase 1